MHLIVVQALSSTAVKFLFPIHTTYYILIKPKFVLLIRRPTRSTVFTIKNRDFIKKISIAFNRVFGSCGMSSVAVLLMPNINPNHLTVNQSINLMHFSYAKPHIL